MGIGALLLRVIWSFRLTLDQKQPQKRNPPEANHPEPLRLTVIGDLAYERKSES